ncbi:DUF6531 domain-containing protein [Methylococcus sp. EFPC2]|uniref:DUF6531 domain-containing protein n=1 Tax=Methylococcus sp. EFPC2 TaxID=2812648 RepID=UPI0019671DC3|nr:DUF6531 domain-containing protein [Methylococcus sp. EFPC2]QSA96127.1 hypothetical protein JWZ97_12895 [Methylococcus sp. EFPC2]
MVNVERMVGATSQARGASLSKHGCRTALGVLVFCGMAAVGSAEACSLSFTSPARGSTVSSATVGVSGTGSGNANPGDIGQVTATLNGVPFFSQTGTFTTLINFLGSGSASVTLQPGTNVFNVTGSVNGCSASDSMVVYYTPPPPQAQKNAGPPACPNGSNPINGATGNKFQEETDYLGDGRLPLRFTRYYNSFYGTARTLGWNWKSSYDHILSVSGNNAYITRPDGRAYRFTLSGSAWLPDGDVNARLLPQTGGGWRFIESDEGVSELYDGSGRLTAIVTAEGWAQDLAYDAQGRLLRVTERSTGRQLSLTYDAQNRLVGLTDPAGGVHAYGYDAGGNLATVSHPDGDANPVNNPVRTYVYNEPAQTSGASLPHALTGIVDENGQRYATYRYDAQGRGIGTEHAGVENYQLAYNANGSTSVTDPLGSVRTYHFQTVLGVVKSTGIDQPAGAGCPASGSALSYDGNGNIARRTDFNGNTHCRAYDLSRNLETARVEGLAPGKSCPADVAAYSPAANTVERKITTAWHPNWRLEARRAEPRKLSTWVYNGQPDPTNGNALASCAPSGALLPDGTPIAVLCKRIEQATTDNTGALGFSATVTGNPRIGSYTYNAQGQVLTEDGPRTDVADITTYAYYSDSSGGHKPGDLWKIANAKGHVTTFLTYNANGRPLTVQDSNGAVYTYAYDAQGRLASKARTAN